MSVFRGDKRTHRLCAGIPSQLPTNIVLHMCGVYMYSTYYKVYILYWSDLRVGCCVDRYLHNQPNKSAKPRSDTFALCMNALPCSMLCTLRSRTGTVLFRERRTQEWLIGAEQFPRLVWEFMRSFSPHMRQHTCHMLIWVFARIWLIIWRFSLSLGFCFVSGLLHCTLLVLCFWFFHDQRSRKTASSYFSPGRMCRIPNR